jgi:DNA-binding CsgD family transcriptional regulator
MNTSIHSQIRSCPLSNREVQCIEGLASGLSNSDIAKQLQISVPTVALHLSNARHKLGAKTREQAVAFAVARGLINLNNCGFG